jgi:hypothetical protein
VKVNNLNISTHSPVLCPNCVSEKEGVNQKDVNQK